MKKPPRAERALNDALMLTFKASCLLVMIAVVGLVLSFGPAASPMDQVNQLEEYRPVILVTLLAALAAALLTHLRIRRGFV